MDKIDNEKNCRNCKFFKKHYIKTSKGFKEEMCGYCANSELDLYQKRKTILKIYNACKYWMPIDLQISERRAGILETLKKMQNSLEELAVILKDDE